jgi:hypothetical protein
MKKGRGEPVANIFVDAFLDGFTGGSLLTRLEEPGAPTQVFPDPEPEASSVPAHLWSLIHDQFALVALEEIFVKELGEQSAPSVSTAIRRFVDKVEHGAVR